MHMADTENGERIPYTAGQVWAIQGGTRADFAKIEQLDIGKTGLLLHIGNMLPRPAARAIFDTLCKEHMRPQNHTRGRWEGPESHTGASFKYGRNVKFTLGEAMKTAVKNSKQNKQIIKIQHHGSIDPAAVGQVMGHFRADKIRITLADGTKMKVKLKKMVQIVKQGRVTQIRTHNLRFRAAEEEHTAAIISKIRRSPKRIWHHCSECTLNDIFIVYKAVSETTKKGDEQAAAKIKSTITRYCKKRYGVHPQPKFYFRCQTLHGLQRSPFKHLLKGILEPMPIGSYRAWLNST
jgi:hypothetical protein